MTLQRTRKVMLVLSFLLFPVTFMYLSPVMALGGTYFGVVSFGLAFWAAVALSAPLVGRAFCSWVCPLGGIQMCLGDASGKSLVPVRYLRVAKYQIWAAWVGSILFLAVKVGGYTGMELMWENPGFPPYELGAHIAWLGFSLLPVVLVLLLGRRAFCHYLCFFSPLNIIGTRVGRWLRLPMLGAHVVAAERCTACQRCSKGCPMSLDVTGMVKQGAIRHPECITCGNCAATCKSDVIRYGMDR